MIMYETDKFMTTDLCIDASRELLEFLEIEEDKSYDWRKRDSMDRVKADLYNWRADILTVHRKKYIVITNIATGFSTVVSRMTKPNRANAKRHIQSGISGILFGERINAFNLQRFNSEMADIVWTEGGRKKGEPLVARVKSLLENYAQENMDKGIVQERLSRILNRYDFTGELPDEHDHRLRPQYAMAELLEKAYGNPPFSKGAYHVTVDLDLNRHDVKRELLIPRETTFLELHKLLQTAFGWSGSHLHIFTVLNEYGEAVAVIEPKSDEDFDDFATIDHDAYYKSLVLVIRSNYSMVYTYDFGDNWEHVILFSKYDKEYDLPYATCIDGEGISPPEDVGGAGGFEDFLEILNDPSHPEYEEMLEFGGYYQERVFDINETNMALRVLYDFQAPFLW